MLYVALLSWASGRFNVASGLCNMWELHMSCASNTICECCKQATGGVGEDHTQQLLLTLHSFHYGAEIHGCNKRFYILNCFQVVCKVQATCRNCTAPSCAPAFSWLLRLVRGRDCGPTLSSFSKRFSGSSNIETTDRIPSTTCLE